MANRTSQDFGASLIEYALLVVALSLIALPAILFLGEAPRDKMCEAAFGVGSDEHFGHGEAYFDEQQGRCCRPAVGFGGPSCL